MGFSIRTRQMLAGDVAVRALCLAAERAALKKIAEE